MAANYAPALASTVKAPEPTADSMILLWMAGGMAHTDTFDPKHYEPFTPGIETIDLFDRHRDQSLGTSAQVSHRRVDDRQRGRCLWVYQGRHHRFSTR